MENDSNISQDKEMVFSSGQTSVFLRDLIREVDIGIHDHEIGHPQSIRFDLEVTIDGSEAPISDEITHVLNYEYLLESVEKSLTEGRVSLLESLGSRILEKMMAPSQVSSAKIQITKLEILKENGTLGCRMTRTR